MNLANKITLIRIGLVPIIMILLLHCHSKVGIISAFVLFLISSITDFLDGYISRKYNMVTALGKFLDPLADKLLVISVLVSFVYLKLINPYVTVIIIFRELIITTFRVVAIEAGVTLAADKLAKVKTTIQLIACCFVILSIYWSWLLLYGIILIYIATIITVISGANYLYKNKKCFKNY